MTAPVASLPAKLLPCPFCGSASIDERGWASENSAGPACDDCGASAGCVSNNLADNIATWNRRALASPAGEGGLPEPALVFHMLDHACDFADGVELLGDTANFYSESQMQSALATTEQPGSSVQAALDYLHPYLDAGTFAAPDWAIDLASILTGGKRLSTPPAPAAEQGELPAGVTFDHDTTRAHWPDSPDCAQPEARGVVTKDMVRQALHFCPSDLSAPGKWTWIAARLNDALATTPEQPGSAVQGEGSVSESAAAIREALASGQQPKPGDMSKVFGGPRQSVSICTTPPPAPYILASTAGHVRDGIMSPAPAAEQEGECFCDARGLGVRGVSCGDCPRDYATYRAMLAASSAESQS